MDADGGSVKRITATAGYDGAAAFDADCSHIVWVASRPRGRELDDYKKQLEDRRLAPVTTDLWVANADGTDARQVTYLDNIVSAPAWYPGQPRIIFSSPYGADNPRDIDLWAIELTGTGLERVTTAPGFDGSPTFSPDGKWLAFSSSRASLLGRRDVNVFIARWGGASEHVEERPADHLLGDSAWLADKARAGRGLGTPGLDDAGAYIERSFKSFGLSPLEGDDFRQEFDATTSVVAQATFSMGGGQFDPKNLRAFGFSSSVAVDGPLSFVGTNDDFARVDVKGKIVVVRQQGRSSLSHTAWVARDRGAVGLLVVADGPLLEPKPDSNQGIAAAMISGEAFRPVLAMLTHGQHPPAHLAVTLAPETAQAFNVVGKWPSQAPADQKLPGVVVIGAHYDGLGEASPGADDNASGTAALLQVARAITDGKIATRRDIVLVALSGEDQGAAGADAFVKHTARGPVGEGHRRHDQPRHGRTPARQHRAGLRRRDGHAVARSHRGRVRHRAPVVQGRDVRRLRGRRPERVLRGGHPGRAPLHRRAQRLPQAYRHGGQAQRHRHGADRARRPGARARRRRPGHQARIPAPGRAIESDQPEFKVSLGTIPDKAGPPGGQKGMLLAGVRPGGTADRAGLKKGDILVRLGGHVIGTVEDVMFVLTDAKPGTKLSATFLRDGKEVNVDLDLEAR